MNGPWHRRKTRQTTHLRDVPDQVTVIRKRHAFEGQTLAVISSIKRGGVLLVLVILPNGSRSLIPAAWTDWHDANASLSDDDIDHTSSLGKLGDLLQLGKVIDTLHFKNSSADWRFWFRSSEKRAGSHTLNVVLDGTSLGSVHYCIDCLLE